MKYDLTYLSFGGGVQSTALLICSGLGLHGVPKADVAVFADTQGELGATYDHVRIMRDWSADHGIHLSVVTAGSLENDVLIGVGQSQISIPAFIKNADGSRGIMRRQCTYDYKLTPIIREVRVRLGLKPGQIAKGRFNVRAMLGISLDEIVRIKPSREEWIENTFPLVDARLRREDCSKIIREAGIPDPPKSACYFCPYRRDKGWRWMRDHHPADFAKAIEFDRKVRTSQPKLIGQAYLHDSLEPLESTDLDREKAQGILDGFTSECEGMCGV